MDTIKLLDAAFASTGAIIASISPDDLDKPTPCTQWDVRTLVNHTTSVVARFGAAAARGEAPDMSTDWVGPDPGATFEQAATTTLAAWSQPGALEGTCQIRLGELPAEVAAGINFLDTLVHGWDLARALGRDVTLDPALATAGLGVARAVMTEQLRGPGKGFGPEVSVAAGASPSDQLVAFLGRQP